MLLITVRDDEADERLKATLEGVSKTVFPQDVRFVLSGTSVSDIRVVTISIFAISRDSPYFRRFAVTHTPTLNFGVGAVFKQSFTVPQSDFLEMMAGAPGITYFNFRLPVTEVGGISVTLEPQLVPKTYQSLDSFFECQFICIIENNFSLIGKAELELKGFRVPFFMFENDNGEWIGSTVFRPTFERFFVPRK